MNRGLLLIVYILIGIWTLFSIYYIRKLWKAKNTNKYNPYLYNSIPSVFTTLGVLGTFSGIFFGLQKFDVANIDESIPVLLEGMKTAFLTSIVGIVLSLIFRPIGQKVLRVVELKEPPKQTNELSALSEIVNVLKETKEETKYNFEKLNTSLIGETDFSISSQLIKLRNQIAENHSEQEKQNELLGEIQSSLTGEEETNLLTQLKKIRSQINDAHNEQKEQKEILENISNTLGSEDERSLLTQILMFRLEQIENNNYLKEEFVAILKNNNNSLIMKFDEFGEILNRNNTEALVEVMKSATETFNAQMSELIEKLVQENFKELNTSVQNLNDWQKENKEMITTLTTQFVKVSDDFVIASSSIKEITQNTTKLTNDNSHLSELIQELQKVMIDDKKFQEIVGKLTGTIDILKENTETFDETTNRLNDWILNEKSFKQSVDILITRLEEVEKIKDINGEFWNNTKAQLEEGVSLISNSSKELRNNLDGISEEFTEQLNQTLTSLDELIQRLVEHYTNR